MAHSKVQYRILDGFNDPGITPELWNRLLRESSSNVIFMTWHWQITWWEAFGEGKLLIILAELDGKPLAIAPLYADKGMIYLVGSGGSDYLDLIGDVSNPDILERILLLAIENVEDFKGFIFYHILENSVTPVTLARVAERQHWNCFEEGACLCPMMSLKEFPNQAHQATRKKSLLRHEGWFKRNGIIQVEHLTRSEEILPHLNTFFNQHITKWNSTPYSSLFLKPRHCTFYALLTKKLSDTGWLRFTRILWDGRPIAFHFGFNYSGCFFWYKPTFDILLAKYSPGEVLLRQLVIRSLEEEAIIFDFGMGDEAFKKRFATNMRVVHNWGLYPRTSQKLLKHAQSNSYQPAS